MNKLHVMSRNLATSQEPGNFTVLSEASAGMQNETASRFGGTGNIPP